MNNAIGKWLLAVSLALNAGLLGAVAWNAARVTTPAAAQHINLENHLKLTETQRRQWLEIEHAFLNDLSTNWQKIRLHREALVREIFSASPVRASIDREQEKIAALQDAQQRRVIDQLLAERKLLNESQRQALMELLLKRYTQEVSEEELLHRK